MPNKRNRDNYTMFAEEVDIHKAAYIVSPDFRIQILTQRPAKKWHSVPYINTASKVRARLLLPHNINIAH